MNRLYWVRHGENKANLTKQFSHRLVDLPLTPKGRLQAQQTAEWFLDKHVTSLYCSPLKRAAETDAIIGQRIDLSPQPVEAFRELNVGDLEKYPPSAAAWATYMQVVEAWRRGATEVAFPGGEDYNTLLERFRSGFCQVMDQARGDLLVVGHGGSFTLVLPDLCPQVDPLWLDGQQSANCSITELAVELVDGQVRGELVSWAKYDHLHGEAAEIVSGLLDEDEFTA